VDFYGKEIEVFVDYLQKWGAARPLFINFCVIYIIAVIQN
jgi:hypothetical protein